jgi:hypothetical protein
MGVGGRGRPDRGVPQRAHPLPMTIVELGGGHHFKSSQRKLGQAILPLARAAEKRAEEREKASKQSPSPPHIPARRISRVNRVNREKLC